MKYMPRLLMIGFAWFASGWSEQTQGPKTIAAAQCADEEQTRKTAVIMHALLSVEDEQELKRNFASVESIIFAQGCSFAPTSLGVHVWSASTYKLRAESTMDGIMVFRVGSALFSPESGGSTSDVRHVIALEVNYDQLRLLLERKQKKREMRDA